MKKGRIRCRHLCALSLILLLIDLYVIRHYPDMIVIELVTYEVGAIIIMHRHLINRNKRRQQEEKELLQKNRA